MFNEEEHVHRRWNPMTESWILICPHRTKRPWKGQTENSTPEVIPEFDPDNPLCPTAIRPGGQINPNYSSTFVFNNDFPALIDDDNDNDDITTNSDSDDLFRLEPVKGVCKVMCFHPKSNVSIPLMSVSEIRSVIDVWIKESLELSLKYPWIQIFENKGSIMGCSNPHPHCQIWASNFIPNEIEIKEKTFQSYFEKHQRPMLMNYADSEVEKRTRIVDENKDWIVLVPYWAVWPYEVMLLPKRRHIPRITDLIDSERTSLAEIMKSLTTRYDNLFETSFPYSMGFHGAPFRQERTEHWQFHGLYYPPLLRSASVKKFMVGYEMLANAQRDLTPERAALHLRNTSSTLHYKFKEGIEIQKKMN